MKKIFLPISILLFSLGTAQAAPLFITDDLSEQISKDTNTIYDDASYKAYNKLFGGSKDFSEEMRLQTMYEYAYNLALQSSVRGNMAQINRDIQRISRELDAIYNFEPLMIHGKVVPPVITEANDIFNQENPLQIRLTDKIYNIVSQARFSSTAPNWRNYLTFPNEQDAFQEQIFSMDALKPKSNKERTVWEKASKEGWLLGRIQSLRILEDAMNRLNRDYIGMVKFHQLVFEGRIDMPAIRGYDLYNTNEGQRLLLGEKLFQIEKLPTFKTPDISSAYEMKLGWIKKNHLSSDDVGVPVAKPKVLEEDYTNLTVRENAERIANGKPIVNKEPKVHHLISSDNLKITITQHGSVDINGSENPFLPKLNTPSKVSENSIAPPVNTLKDIEIPQKPKVAPTAKETIPLPKKD